MTTMRTLLTRAGRLTRARALGDTLAAEEMEAILEDAQAFFLQLTARELTDVLITADYEAAEDERITWTSGSPTVTYPTSIADLCGDRPPRNGAIVEVAGADWVRKIYVSEEKAWNTINGLELTDNHPFGETQDEALAAMIAVRVAGTVFQREAPSDVQGMAEVGRYRFDARFNKPIRAEVDPALRARPYWYNPLTGLSS